MEKKKITEGLAGFTASSAKKVKDVASDLSVKATRISKEKMNAINKDIDEMTEWIIQRNEAVKQADGKIEPIKYDDLPALGKVIFRGDQGIASLPENDKSKYIEFFAKNGSRIAVLTAINPVLGLGAAGIEAAAKDLLSTKSGITMAAAGAGLSGLSAAAIASVPSCASATAMAQMLWYVPGLQYVGAGLFALGAGVTLFKAIEKLPQGKKLLECCEEAHAVYVDKHIQLENNMSIMGTVLAAMAMRASDKLEEASKKIAITIDDALHSDQNLRLMQYHEIILNLYNSQNEIRNELAALTKKYNELQIENQRLLSEMNDSRIVMQATACLNEWVKTI